MPRISTLVEVEPQSHFPELNTHLYHRMVMKKVVAFYVLESWKLDTTR
jgi:hypothetical protein